MIINITKEKLNGIRECYDSNNEDLRVLKNFIKKNGETDSGIKDSAESFEQGFKSGMEYIAKQLDIKLD